MNISTKKFNIEYLANYLTRLVDGSSWLSGSPLINTTVPAFSEKDNKHYKMNLNKSSLKTDSRKQGCRSESVIRDPVLY
jgi:hypothetical protein